MLDDLNLYYCCSKCTNLIDKLCHAEIDSFKRNRNNTAP